MTTAVQTQVRTNNRLLFILLAVAAGMMLFFLFGFTAIYTLYCKATGTAMRPNNAKIAAAASVSTGRFIAVRFESKIFDGLPLTFAVDHPQQQVEVGTYATNGYSVTNPTDQPLHVRPVHQVSPINATVSFAMRICFCFQDQVLAPHETKHFPVEYRFAPTLDARINDVALCYSLFDIKDGRISPDLKRTEAAAKQAIVADPE
jgi:cytochrome c oxidase assembly protein subunit 11